MTQRHSDEDILEAIRDVYDEHGEVSPRLLNEKEDAPSASTAIRRFDDWMTAKQEAGVTDSTEREPKYSDEQLLSALRELERREGKATIELMNEHDDLPGPTVYVERFGSWSEAKVEAGLASDQRYNNKRPRVYSDEDYLELIRECAERHGEATQRNFNQDDDFPSAGAVRKRFGSWSRAKELAGLEKNTRRYTEEELLTLLRDAASQVDGSLSASRLAAMDNMPAPETYQRRFGSWNDAKKEANIA